ncbi:hypothetical protein ABW19_dt0205480 [Dactylella cylindrospora]|nr:hypothetical protein ABW19_dt0205480 [Dactylella cylindrospora]
MLPSSNIVACCEPSGSEFSKVKRKASSTSTYKRMRAKALISHKLANTCYAANTRQVYGNGPLVFLDRSGSPPDTPPTQDPSGPGQDRRMARQARGKRQFASLDVSGLRHLSHRHRAPDQGLIA